MSIALSYKEKRVCESARISCAGRVCDLGYVYFIVHRRRIIYIGTTMNPYQRDVNHAANLDRQFGVRSYTVKFVGPFKYSLALKIEENEIARYSSSWYLINKNLKKYKHNEKFSIENFGRKTVSFIRKAGERKKVVCQYIDK